MKKVMMALALCLMSAIGCAETRQMAAILPTNTPCVSLTIDGNTHKVQLTKAVVREVDDKHVKCIVYAGKDKAEITLPISYNLILQLGERVAELCHTMNIITEKQYTDFLWWYNHQIACEPQNI